jgi:FixJ family two-component response regulator
MTGQRNSYVAIVDDDESVCRSFGRLLRTAGYQPVTYSSAESFLEDTKRPRFDCLVLDLQLQGISGLELSNRLAAVNDTTPILFITAQDDSEERATAEASGCVGYFRKTEPGERILESIEEAIRYAKEPEAHRPHTHPTP